MQRNMCPAAGRGCVDFEAAAHRPVRTFQQNAQVLFVVPGVEILFALPVIGRHAEQHGIQNRRVGKGIARVGRLLLIHEGGDVALAGDN